ncbi:hypothetical protein TWF730_004315 [Orbilia blumenaviensis]|uniref:Uncharacterized protein n=1 Tax=Orbilia blumenaviensis TaxID=1796055 RepID=A0AAV9TZV3_9PEZI
MSSFYTIIIRNNLDCELELIGCRAIEGRLESLPEILIRASKDVQFRLSQGTSDVRGKVTYRVRLPNVRDNHKPGIHICFTHPTPVERGELQVSATTQGNPLFNCPFFPLQTTHPNPGPIDPDQTSDRRHEDLIWYLDVGYREDTRIKPLGLAVVRSTSFDEIRIPPEGLEIWNLNNVLRWEDDSDVHFAGSYFPIAIDVAQTSLPKIIVRVRLPPHVLGIPLVLEAGNDACPILAASDIILIDTARIYDVSVTVRPPWREPGRPWAVAGSISWRLGLMATGQRITLNSTRLELYAIANKLPEYYKGFVDVRLLRRFVATARLPLVSWIDHCIHLIHSEPSFVHDSQQGQPHYYFNDRFNLIQHLGHIGQQKPVNCFDQAAIMLACLGLNPDTHNAKFVSMRPFGWIKPTWLVGEGMCNNPFYQDRQHDSQIRCGDNNTSRSRFTCHAFISLGPIDQNPLIVDACCGPYNGGLGLQQYKGSLIHTPTQTTLSSGLGLGGGLAQGATEVVFRMNQDG